MEKVVIRYNNRGVLMDKEQMKQNWLNESSKGMQGWDFSYLEGRTEEESLPWDYKEVVRKYLCTTDTLLDMGTGGGEFLLTFNHPHKLTSVTEGYLPNFALCEKKLGGLGITVKYVNEDDHLDFADSSFDIVINRHESYDVHEVLRVLKPGGYFITQQIGAENNRSIAEFIVKDLPDSPYKDHTLEMNVKKIENVGLRVFQAKEHFPEMKFYDIGAFVYFASIINWEFPDFSVENCMDRLMELEEQRKDNGYIASKEHRFMIVAQKE